MQKQVIVSAADAVTAKLVQEAGFDGIWVSGFEASARLGLADNGSITMTEMLNIAKPIVDAVTIPVWVDVDTGYGNFQRTVKEFERIGVAGVCVQDDVDGQKTNSLWGGKTPLMPMEDFCKKISVTRGDIQIIARTESLIRGYGQSEALKRLFNYRISGADIVLPHVRDEKDILKIDSYFRQTAIVPTKFPHYTTKQLFDLGYTMIIWANQTERVKIKATRECLGSLKGSDCAEYIEANLSATLDDMKGLCGE
jgi:phosphoenolpyruvate phosphomutase